MAGRAEELAPSVASSPRAHEPSSSDGRCPGVVDQLAGSMGAGRTEPQRLPRAGACRRGRPPGRALCCAWPYNQPVSPLEDDLQAFVGVGHLEVLLEKCPDLV